jgi:hypothetical protein
LYIVNPAAGVAIAFLCAVVSRGGKKPLLVENTSRMADVSGVLVLMPDWAMIPFKPITAKIKIMICLIF